RPERRLPALVRHVEGLHADLACLQEVEDETFAALKARLGDYEGHYEKKRGKPDGCATFFRRGVFAPHGVKRLEYRDTPQLAGLLSLEPAGRLLGVANTHLRWDRPETSLAEQVGYRQALELLTEGEAYRPFQDGWLVCGDFNRTPDSGVVSLLLQGGFFHP